MKITNHRLEGVPYEPARWQNGPITPTAFIVHDTASWLTKFSAKEYLRDNRAKAKPSAHLVAEIYGFLTQLVPFNRGSNHAGTSVLHGRSGCNGFTLGIEIVNRGLMRRHSATQAITWFGEKIDIEDAGLVEMTTKEHGRGFWEPYPSAQIEAVIASLTAAFGKYQTLKGIYPHWYISPGRKIDTNPLFPLEQVRAKVLGRDDLDAEEADGNSDEVDSDAFVRINAPGDSLNMRRWPSFNPNVILSIPHGVEVPVLRSGRFAWGTRSYDWHKVLYGGREGWIVARYTN